MEQIRCGTRKSVHYAFVGAPHCKTLAPPTVHKQMGTALWSHLVTLPADIGAGTRSENIRYTKKCTLHFDLKVNTVTAVHYS